MKKKEPPKFTAAVRWKNGDRQFIEVELHNGVVQHEVMWRVGTADGGGHASGAFVALRLLSLNGSTAGGRLIYVEFP